MNTSRYNLMGPFSVSPVVKNLLIINVLFYLAKMVFAQSFQLNLDDYLALYFPASHKFQAYQLLTHMFMHGSFGHILGNMFALFMFGSAIEQRMGSKRFLTYYFVSGFGALLLYEGVQFYQFQQIVEHIDADRIAQVLNIEVINGSFRTLANMTQAELDLVTFVNSPVLGASGAVFGILLAFGMLFPNQIIYLSFLFPIKAKWFVLIYGGLELYLGINNNPGDNVAHFAHLGGMLFGFLLIKYWNKKANTQKYN